MKSTPLKFRWTPIFASLLLLGGAPAVLAQAHDHGHAATTAPALKPGQKWATDAALREGMEKIRAALAPQMKAIHENRLPAAQYKAIAHESTAQMSHIVQNCKLEPNADAALHEILGQLGEGVSAMEGGNVKLKPNQGARKVVAALDRYGKTFDHPGWKPLH